MSSTKSFIQKKNQMVLVLEILCIMWYLTEHHLAWTTIIYLKNKSIMYVFRGGEPLTEMEVLLA